MSSPTQKASGRAKGTYKSMAEIRKTFYPKASERMAAARERERVDESAGARARLSRKAEAAQRP